MRPYALVVVLGSSASALAQSSATVGSMRGVVRDETGAQVAGATIIATSAALVGEQVAITDQHGHYFIAALPPGGYTLTILYGRKFSRPNITIRVGKDSVVNVRIDMSDKVPAGEVVEITSPAPLVDQGSTKLGVTITDTYTRNIPTGRTFGDVLGAAAGTRQDGFGTSFAGATSPENVYLVDGINTTDTGFGRQSSNLPNELVAETEIITGGYNAEFGRATGGIVSVVTKTGGNEFHGSVFGFWRPGALSAGAKTIDVGGSAIDSRSDLDYDIDAGFELGGPIVKNKLWFHVGFVPSHSAATETRLVHSQLDDDGDGVPDVDPETGFTRFVEVSRSEHAGSSTTYFFTSKLNGALNPDHQYQVSLFGNPNTTKAVGNLNGNVAHAPRSTAGGSYDLAGKWTSKFRDGKTQLDVVLGSHHGLEKDEAVGAAREVPIVQFNFDRSLGDFAALERDPTGCQDDGPQDPYPMITNCPVFSYRTQGGGFEDDFGFGRRSALAAVTHRVEAAGYHVLKAGADIERTTFDHAFGFTGGVATSKDQDGIWNVAEELAFVRNLDPGEDPAMVELDPARAQRLCANDKAICEQVGRTRSTTRHTNLSAFVQDSWQIQPNLTLDVGFRWERLTAYVADGRAGAVTPEGEVIPEVAFALPHLIAPRIGVIYDPTHEGKSKVFAHWGRFYENIPMAVSRLGFGSDIFSLTQLNARRLESTDPEYDANCDVDFTATDPAANLYDRLRQCGDRQPRFIAGEGTIFVAPNLEGQYTQDLVLGAELEITSGLKLGASYQHRSLPQVVEDVSPDGVNYALANPGRDYSALAEQYRIDAERLAGEGNEVLAGAFQTRARLLDQIGALDKPVRDYDAVQVTFQQRPTRSALVLASYTYSRTRGNYDGLAISETGQLLPNLTTLYDSTALTLNRNGTLGGDRPHNFKLDGFYLFELGRIGQVTVGASFRAISGIPHSILAIGPTYGTPESFLIEKGTFTRSPLTTQLDLHLAYGRRLSKTVTIEGFVRVFDVFDRQAEIDVDQIYSFDRVDPIIGGDLEDLKHVKAHDRSTDGEVNQTPRLNPNFGRPTALQSPRNVQLGVRLTF